MKNIIQLMLASAALITALSLAWLTLTTTGLFGYWHTPLVRTSGDQLPSVGRFQLVEVTYLVEIAPNGASRTEQIDQKVPAVFLLDTASGKVWEYNKGVGLNDEAYEYWKDVRK